MEFILIGGNLIIEKKVFTKEMLTKESLLKVFLRARDIPNKEGPKIEKEGDYVRINYNHSSGVDLGENYEEKVKALKGKYRNKVKGKLTFQVNNYSTYHSSLDLNSDSDKVYSD